MSSASWVICFVSIRFDLDIGPVIEHVAPPDALSDEGKRILSQVAFPDCNPESGHDLIFFFHMRDCTAAAERSSAETVSTPSTGGTVTNIYGATYYRQKQDALVPRGYVQQAVVLLSRVPYMAVHELILRVVVPRLCQCCSLSPDLEKVPVLSALSPVPTTFFEVDSSFNASQYSQKEVLERAMEEIEGWPSPHPHVQYNLTLLYQPITFVTPRRSLQPVNRKQIAVARRLMQLDDRVTFLGSKHQEVSVHDVIPLYALLNEHLRHLTQLWELLLCHESLFIWSNTPSMASAAAFAVASLVQPIEFNGVLRSYLTVQDEAFGRFSRMGNAIPFPTTNSIIVAVTNPFFFRSFDGWRNVLTVVDRQARSTGSAAMTGNDCNEGCCNSAIAAAGAAAAAVAASALANGQIIGSPGAMLCPNRSGCDLDSPRIFTYRNFFPVLTVATQPAPTRQDSASGGSGIDAFFDHRQAVNSFRSPFQFLVDHKAQTAILLHRLEQASRLNAEAQLASLNAHLWNGGGTLEESGGDGKDGVSICEKTASSQPFSQYSIADDIVRKFFDTLTKEFLMPVSAWFQSMTNTLTVFHLCDPATVNVLVPESFLRFLKDNRETVPSFLSRHPYKAYSAMYERFAKGSLFCAVVWQLLDRKIRQGLEDTSVDEWAAQHPMEAERIDMFINLYKLVQREVSQTIDPDVVFVTTAISVLAGMTAYVNEPLRDQLMLKIRELKL
ncbi:hypothetical protein DQ04_07341000 [Trypanosoma grayi]|uniref:hypothetical protein n=1 Tax=Trypanosoma grayi TaxID=71804 RepID=UPI0004F4B54A|nr:hypothetical protein DQ04_07341000 [Trypanosoma grayi]KEG08370.1 hypothetical protein DQ04_07341000 [Trypanosoma grayi]